MFRFSCSKHVPIVLILLLTLLMTSLAIQSRQLQQQNHALNGQVDQLQRAMHGPRTGVVPVHFNVTSLRGDHVELAGPASGRQVLYFFSTACRYCLASVPHVQALEKSSGKAGAFKLVGISLPPHDSTPDYIRRHALTFPVISDSDGRIADEYSATVVPMIVVLHHGKVIYRHVGELNEATVNAVAQTFVGDAQRSAVRG
jgi:peroxiredoxin